MSCHEREAEIRRALERSAARGVDSALYSGMAGTFEDCLAAEEDDEGNAASDSAEGLERMRQRLAAVRVLFRFLLADGPHPASILKRVFTVGRGLGMPFFSQLTMTEAAAMCGETKAAQSYRLKVLSGLIRLRGQHGARFAGQKSSGSSLSYEAAARGNQNRRKSRPKKITHP